MIHVKRRPLFPALLALVLTSCPGCYAHQCLPGEVALIESREIPELAAVVARMDVQAVTIGRHVFVHPDAAENSVLVRHELEHVAQWERGGLAFSLDYVWQTVLHGYERNPFELAADSAAMVVAHGPNR